MALDEPAPGVEGCRVPCGEGLRLARCRSSRGPRARACRRLSGNGVCGGVCDGVAGCGVCETPRERFRSGAMRLETICDGHGNTGARASTHRWWCKRLGAPENQPVRHDACGERRQACAGRMRGQRFVLERSSAVWRGRRFSIRAGGHGAGIAKIRSGLRSVAVQGRTWGRSHAPRLCPAASALSPAAVTRSTRVAAALQKNKPSGRFTSVHPDATLRSSHGCPCARPPLPLMGDGGQPERRST